ncbi:hypothetical protein UFOVP144_22 [uncultured Caudovirales phage]|uniref:Uncharacterized protein n=1 Tax=uncultured Caudovirales phage TaxID=2100421 RepID=A0A6J7XQZ6_9CAUD|nr:hypothetical protein UFOVP144_22 [uncultured Caudovirales phage]
MSDKVTNIHALLRMASQEADATEAKIQQQQDSILYLQDKLNKVFHSLRYFHNNNGRDLDPETLDAFNAAWRNHEASFDTWQSYTKTGIFPENDFNIE